MARAEERGTKQEARRGLEAPGVRATADMSRFDTGQRKKVTRGAAAKKAPVFPTRQVHHLTMSKSIGDTPGRSPAILGNHCGLGYRAGCEEGEVGFEDGENPAILSQSARHSAT